MNAQLLHQKALEAVKSYSIAEAQLLTILQEIDLSRAYRDLGHTSLFTYAVQGLKLSESTAYNFIAVARKAREVPALMIEISKGTLSISKARKITPVLTRDNQAEWIANAQSLSQKSLEKEVARVAPREATRKRATYISETQLKLTLGISEKLHLKLKRVVDLESQRTRQAIKLEGALEAMAELYLERNDPLEKAKRSQTLDAKRAQTQEAKGLQPPDTTPTKLPVVRQAKLTKPGLGARSEPTTRPVPSNSTRAPLPATVRHAVNLRDQRQCSHIDKQGTRCTETRWLDLHHIKPLYQGGGNEADNLTTVCFAHHRMAHAG